MSRRSGSAAGSTGGSACGPALPRSFFARDSLEVAPELLNKVLVAGERALRIVEVEAYRGQEDPASHAYRGPTRRNATMFGRPGLLYVYRSYGLHFCANVVCGTEGVAVAVLLRAGAPVWGLPALRAARPTARTDTDLARGPGRLCQALGIDLSYDGADLTGSDGRLRLAEGGWPVPSRLERGPRVGVSAAADRHWRWWIAGDPHVSRARPAR
ncbi:MAG: DNA-3-methyladenine glycosylase [Acidimicrobiales bacterium]|nr:DNA-3-methyladenine glycosylase [Acidimicrobiales bacterium]